MKICKCCFLFILITALIAVFAPVAAQAADEDFDVSYLFSPDVVGYLGGDVTLRLDVTNTGATDITWVDVVINNQTTFHNHWEGTIAPGRMRQLWITVPFQAGDLNQSRILQVSMNNNTSANPDGIKMFSFEIESTSDIAGIAASITPDKDVYHVGDTITVTHTFSAENDGYYLVDAQYQITLDHDMPRRIYDSGMISHGDITPSEDAVHTFSYTFHSDDIGEVAVVHALHFSQLGRTYHIVDPSMFLTVEEAPPPDFDFDVYLSASPTTIDAGELVTFTIDVTDSGETTLTGIELRNAEGGLIDVLPPIGVGNTRSFITTAHISETTGVSYVVICADGYGNSDSIETNTVTITVREPEESAPPPSTPTALPSPTLTPDVDETPMPSMQTDDAFAAAASDEPDGEVITLQPQQDNTALYVVIGILGAVVIAGAVIAILLLRKKKPKGTPKEPNRNDIL